MTSRIDEYISEEDYRLFSIVLACEYICGNGKSQLMCTKFPLGGVENVLKLIVVLVVQLCQDTKTH